MIFTPCRFQSSAGTGSKARCAEVGSQRIGVLARRTLRNAIREANAVIARHRRVTQCLGSLGGKEWLIGVAPPGDLGDDACPRLEDIVAFRVPGDRLIKLHVATWHAGPHFVHDECLFVNPRWR